MIERGHGRGGDQLDCFAIAAPGLEALVADELRGQGIDGVVDPGGGGGGVAWRGSLGALTRANLWSRIASRIVVRVAEFRARTFFELERHARRVPWETFVTPGVPVTFRVTCRKSKLYHSDAVAQRLGQAMEHRLGAWSRVSTTEEGAEGPEGEEGGGRGEGGQLFIVRVVHDLCTVSADSSGALLHLRGYREAVAKAPLRETLGAAVLAGAGWNGATPLVDPMCGSGTIPIEAAMVARRIAPGLRRRFAFMQWPGFDRVRWAEACAEAEGVMIPASHTAIVIQGSDRDAGAIAAAQANAERAGVAQDIHFSVRSLSAIEPPPMPGTLAVNPPYGVRLGEVEPLRNLYAQLGQVARRKCPGWTLALLSADPRLDRQLQTDLTERFRTSNGGIPIRLLVGAVG